MEEAELRDQRTERTREMIVWEGHAGPSVPFAEDKGHRFASFKFGKVVFLIGSNSFNHFRNENVIQ